MNEELTPFELAEVFMHGFKPADDSVRDWLIETVKAAESKPAEWYKQLVLKTLTNDLWKQVSYDKPLHQVNATVFYKEDQQKLFILLNLHATCLGYALNWAIFKIEYGLLIPCNANKERASITEALS